MTKHDEVGVLGELINHGQDDAFAVNARKTFDEIKRDVRPDL
jgi:hypothetical protein